jgi:hypothetical protein
MSVRTPIRLAALVPVACATALLAACGSPGGGSPTSAGGGSQPVPTASSSGSQPTPTASRGNSSSGNSSSGSGPKCTALTAAAASAAVGKATTVTLDPGSASLPGLTICDVVIADEVYPVQLAVDTNGGESLYDADEQVMSGKDLSGVGDKAFTSSISVEVLSGGVDIKVTGPAGPVLSGDYTVPTALAKAMVAAIQ